MSQFETCCIRVVTSKLRNSGSSKKNKDQ